MDLTHVTANFGAASMVQVENNGRLIWGIELFDQDAQ